MIVSSPKELKDYLVIGRPIISFDHGMSKIGSALTTPDHLVCIPGKIIQENDFHKQVELATKLIIDTNSCIVIVGLPLSMDGTKNHQCSICEKFANFLDQSCNLPIYMQDERLTSKTADNLLKIMGMKRKARNQRDDSIAASLILETALQQINRF